MTSNDDAVQESGEQQLQSEHIDRETAIDVVHALDEVLNEGDWWRLEDAVSSRRMRRLGRPGSEQDAELVETIRLLNNVRQAETGGQ